MVGSPVRGAKRRLNTSPEETVRAGAVEEVRDGARRSRDDRVTVEEPLEIRLVFGPVEDRREQAVAVTMRTPGCDLELALGFLRSEGVVADRSQVEIDAPETNRPPCNVVRVRLRPDVVPDLDRLRRNFYTTSSCGVCSKASLEALKIVGCKPLATDGFAISAEIVHQLPARLRLAQSDFVQTGGVHAAGLFDDQGNPQSVHEDVGRHNAVDKLVGECFLKERLPLSGSLLLVSGRSSFEIMQKALAAGIPVVAAVGAPSSLAVDVARQYQMTLLGFVRDGGFNIYCGAGRIV